VSSAQVRTQCDNTRDQTPTKRSRPRRNRNWREGWWEQILPDPAVTGDVLAVALIISTEAWWQDGSRAVMSTSRLAKSLGVSTRTVKRHTQKLRELGYLELTERGHRRV
jgi:hypothetical protein